MRSGPKIVVIGGGTGSFMVLSGLKNYSHHLTSIVNMVDDGGSTGILRDEMGVLPPGDVRQSLVALSESSESLRDLFNFRFSKGDLKGHNFGNLFISALEEISGDFGEAVRTAEEILSVQGRVVPVTLDEVRLELKSGKQHLIGENQISKSILEDINDIKLDVIPKSAKINPSAKEAIEAADLIVVAPGNLYSSLLATLVIEGVTESIKKSRAKVVSVCNLMNLDNHTPNFTVADYANRIHRVTGCEFIDYVIYHDGEYPSGLLSKYAKDGEKPVNQPESFPDNIKFVGTELISKTPYEQNPSDIHLQRTLIRHDPDLVARSIMKILFSE